MMTLWWVWLAAAVVLAILEVLVPSYVFLGFAIGAAVAGVALWLGVKVSVPWLLLIFAVVSLAAWMALRAALGVRKGQVRIWDRDINED
ncbi:hypothetical protein C8N32_11356 [Rhodovulum imhoffii]|uniref:NfeD-like partner-binding protein n=1 Tax=Rhodovulum imhoffii TaxID=365340 RepID=A0A2T5BQU1_9RHOB|nr:hypothetical protein [Rhodovulum imhoffii]MBK5934278.1 hypothetical protein [Rhodovulum imhoffii]PTN01447.1 hypothetical protein C8N32_11356 [Rhodovulum imhoffii]